MKYRYIRWSKFYGPVDHLMQKDKRQDLNTPPKEYNHQQFIDSSRSSTERLLNVFMHDNNSAHG